MPLIPPRSLLPLLLSAALVPAAFAAGDGETCASSSSPRALVDITAPIDASLVTFEKADGLGPQHRRESSSHDAGDPANVSELAFGAHTGTHVDAPRHFSRKDARGVETIPLATINGPALVVDAFGVPLLDAEALEAIAESIPDSPAVSRVIFRTDNTRRDLMRKTPFAEDYVGFSKDGAEWMVKKRPLIEAVGVDYVSVAAYAHLVTAHVVLLDAGKVPIEGLVVPEETVAAGWWNLHCAPLKIAGSDGAPARAWLTQMEYK